MRMLLDRSPLAYVTAATYWSLILCWSAILVFCVREYRRLRKLNPLIATLIMVIFIDGARTCPNHAGRSSEEQMFEVYDLRADPYEFSNLAGQPEAAEVERELQAALQEWMILNQDHLPLPIPPERKRPK